MLELVDQSTVTVSFVYNINSQNKPPNSLLLSTFEHPGDSPSTDFINEVLTVSLMTLSLMKKQFLLKSRFTTDDIKIRIPNSQAVCLLPESRGLSKALSLLVQCQGKADV